jgi:hypothetical protein
MKKNKKVARTEKVHFEVLKTDIARGKQGDPSECAVARAIERQGYQKVRVVFPTLTVSKGGIAYSGKIPTRTKTFISKFDGAETKDERVALKPFRFEVLLTETITAK